MPNEAQFIISVRRIVLGRFSACTCATWKSAIKAVCYAVPEDTFTVVGFSLVFCKVWTKNMHNADAVPPL